MTKIDWTKSIELTDGRPLRLVKTLSKGARVRVLVTEPGCSPSAGDWYYNDDGSCCGLRSYLRVRNRAEVKPKFSVVDDVMLADGRQARILSVDSKVWRGRPILIEAPNKYSGRMGLYYRAPDGSAGTHEPALIHRPVEETVYRNLYTDLTVGQSEHRGFSIPVKQGKTRLALIRVTKRGSEVLKTEIVR